VPGHLYRTYLPRTLRRCLTHFTTCCGCRLFTVGTFGLFTWLHVCVWTPFAHILLVRSCHVALPRITFNVPDWLRLHHTFVSSTVDLDWDGRPCHAPLPRTVPAPDVCHALRFPLDRCDLRYPVRRTHGCLLPTAYIPVPHALDRTFHTFYAFTFCCIGRFGRTPSVPAFIWTPRSRCQHLPVTPGAFTHHTVTVYVVRTRTVVLPFFRSARSPLPFPAGGCHAFPCHTTPYLCPLPFHWALPGYSRTGLRAANFPDTHSTFEPI